MHTSDEGHGGVRGARHVAAPTAEFGFIAVECLQGDDLAQYLAVDRWYYNGCQCPLHSDFIY